MQSVICTHYDADTLAAVTDTSKLFQLQTFKTFISEMYARSRLFRELPLYHWPSYGTYFCASISATDKWEEHVILCAITLPPFSTLGAICYRRIGCKNCARTLSDRPLMIPLFHDVFTAVLLCHSFTRPAIIIPHHQSTEPWKSCGVRKLTLAGTLFI